VSPIGVTELFDRYKKGNEESIWKVKETQTSGDTSKLTEQERWLLRYSQPADVKVVGVWDTVGSVGVAAGNISGIDRSDFDYLQTGLRIHILNGYHALAIDEHRPDSLGRSSSQRSQRSRRATIFFQIQRVGRQRR